MDYNIKSTEKSCFNCRSSCVTGQCFVCRNYSHFQLKDEDDDKQELIEALHDMVRQACFNRKDEEYDSMALTAYAIGLKVLEKHGRVTITAEEGRRVIAKDNETNDCGVFHG